MVYIKDNKVNSSKKIETHIKPQIVYIPLESKLGVVYRHLVKEGDYVYKGDVIAVNDDVSFPIHSSVSGYVICGTKKIISSGKTIKCIVIENDFKEKYRNKIGSKRNISNYTREEFVKLLRFCGITGLSGSDFPTFLKYGTDTNINYLIVNGIECEPYVSCDNAIMYQYAEELLECIDAVMEIMNIKKSYIAIKEDNYKIISCFLKYINTYPNIKLYGIGDYYPSGWERSLVKTILNIDYKKHPIEKGIIVNNVSTMYAIYEMLKCNRPLTERVITITGDGVKNPVNVKVKIGSLISEIATKMDIYKKNVNNHLFIVGGPMMGISLPNDEVVVTKDLNCILVLNNIDEKVYPCIKCGKCAQSCPSKLIPVAIMNSINDPKKLKQLHCNKCTLCGTCSYVCPSRIELREFIRKAKDKL